ncbi:hypothetical protein ACDL29_10370 [Pseudomonas aeruginosa]|uniref:hypothetical protein n=1 Tax=Pseudomonas aeruginosa TaxID=287 RepID=UPI0035584242
MSVPLRAVQLTEPSLFLQEHPEVQFVDLLISDMNGVVRGKRIERNSLPKVFEKGINLASPAPTPTPTCCWPRCLPGCTTG